MTCLVCGTANPNGGMLSAYRDGREIGAICAYRFGCQPGVTRPENG